VLEVLLKTFEKDPKKIIEMTFELPTKPIPLFFHRSGLQCTLLPMQEIPGASVGGPGGFTIASRQDDWWQFWK